MYDSRPTTMKHILRVRELLDCVRVELKFRGITHDISKLSSPEKEIFDKFTPLLKDSTYGTEEYNNFLLQMKVALDHHYSVSRHHPEYYQNGIQEMTLIDLIEMLIDQKSAAERQNDANVFDSIEINQKRFGYSDEIKQIFINTLKQIISIDKKSEIMKNNEEQVNAIN